MMQNTSTNELLRTLNSKTIRVLVPVLLTQHLICTQNANIIIFRRYNYIISSKQLQWFHQNNAILLLVPLVVACRHLVPLSISLLSHVWFIALGNVPTQRQSTKLLFFCCCCSFFFSFFFFCRSKLIFKVPTRSRQATS